jgi:transcriptional regulator with XRE-family HTH domain
MAKRLRRFRTQGGQKMTLNEVAKRVGVPVTTYRDWEYGREIKGEPYLRLSEAFGVSLTELLGGDLTQENRRLMGKLKSLKALALSIEKDVLSLF